MTATLLEQPELSPVLVGRQPQRDLLVQCMEQALDGQGAVVMVAGQAGVGKTRLLAEVEPEAGARGLVFLRGAADPVRSGLAYGLFIGVLRGYLQQVAPPQQRALRKTIEELAPHLRQALFPRARRRLVASVGQVDPEVCQTLFLARLARLLLELAGQGPVVVCLEDLHGADSASLQALGYLVRRTGSAPLVVVGTYRPEALDEPGRPAGLAAVLQGLEQTPHYQAVELEGLSEVETRMLVSSCFSGSGFGNELLSTLYERTGGVPLFIVQYLESLRDKGVVFERRGLWLDRPLRGSEVPASIHAAVQERLQDLSAEERQVLSYAAVQGEVFASELVAQGLGWAHARVLQILERLERTTHLVRRHDSTFCFAHILLLNTLYSQLSEAQRRDAHLRLATCLEQRPARDVERLAYHLYRAAALDRALPYLLETARHAALASAYWEAHGFLTQALEALEQTEDPQQHDRRLETLLALGRIDGQLGELDRSRQLYQEVLEAARSTQDRESTGQALLELGWLHHRKGEWEPATRHYQEALDIFATIDAAQQSATAYLRLGNIDFERARLDEAATRFKAAKNIALKSRNYALLGGIYGNLGVVASVRGHHAVALSNYTSALQAYRQIKYHYGVAQTYQNLGMTYAAQQAWEEALTCYDKGEKLARDMGTLDVVANILVSRASVQLELGVLEEAAASGLSARIYYEQMQDRLGLAECHKVEGMIGREQANYAEATARLAQARQAFQALDNPLGVAECDLELGLVRQRRSDLPGARACWQGALELFEQIGAVHQIHKAQTLLATLEAF